MQINLFFIHNIIIKTSNSTVVENILKFTNRYIAKILRARATSYGDFAKYFDIETFQKKIL